MEPWELIVRPPVNQESEPGEDNQGETTAVIGQAIMEGDVEGVSVVHSRSALARWT